MFVVSGFAIVAFPPRNDVSEDVEVAGRPPAGPTTPQAHWDMSTLKDGKLQNLADPSGSTDGTIFNAVPSENGLIGGSLDFNGNSAAVESPDPNNLLKSDSGTVSAWIKSTGKPPETAKLRAAIVVLENGAAATDEDKRLLRLVGENATRIYGEIVHEHGSLEVSDTIYTQTPVELNIMYPHLVELNNFLALGNPDIYDYICFFVKMPQNNWPSGMMNFKNTINGIGRPYMWYDDRANTTTANDTDPNSSYITSAAVLSSGKLPTDESRVDFSAKILVHELSHAYCAWWNYTVDGATYSCPKYDAYHYTAGLRTDLHSALGGFGWRDNHDGTWTPTAYLIPYWPSPPFPPSGSFDFVDFNMDEYTIGLIPASEIVPSHLIDPDKRGFGMPGATITANDSMSLTPGFITKEQVLEAMGPWWNEEDRQCVMLRCTNEYGDVFQGQGWGLFVGTVAPNDHIYWYSGSADGAVEWRSGNARVCDGAWHNIAVTFTGTTGKLYVDGVLDIQWEINPVMAADNVHTVIGCEDPTNPYFESWFSGSIDEVYIYNSVLTDAQILDLYDSPVTTAALSGTLGNNGWYTSAVTVTLTADDANGVKATYYKIDSAKKYTTYTGPFQISADSKHTVHFYSEDSKGYTETAKSVSVWVDQTDPTTSATPNYRKLTVTLSATDGAGSGVLWTYYVLNSRTYAYTGPIKMIKGTQTIYYYSVDNAGNQEVLRSSTFTF